MINMDDPQRPTVRGGLQADREPPDPRLSSDPDTGRNEKVVMWSYPIVDDG
jgi:hypothetical protein